MKLSSVDGSSNGNIIISAPDKSFAYMDPYPAIDFGGGFNLKHDPKKFRCCGATSRSMR